MSMKKERIIDICKPKVESTRNAIFVGPTTPSALVKRDIIFLADVGRGGLGRATLLEGALGLDGLLEVALEGRLEVLGLGLNEEILLGVALLLGEARLDDDLLDPLCEEVDV
ncbi:hypothetical protein MXB_2656 [Myxobolus squamalis]|nr:hypothetical protein MXB_2656 [Myxobolus squamalis]